MIHIEEKILDQGNITIKLDGVLDEGSIPILKSVFERHSDGERDVSLDLEGLVHITRDGREFLSNIKNKARMIHLPEFINLEKRT